MILAIAAIAALAGQARADWKDMKPGMEYNNVVHCAGVPLLQVHGKGGNETWTYDNCGYIQFQYGRVTYFEPPKPPVVAVANHPAASVARASNAARRPKSHAAAPTVVAKN